MEGGSEITAGNENELDTATLRVMNRLREVEIAHRAGVGVHRRFLDGKSSGEWFYILKVKIVM